MPRKGEYKYNVDEICRALDSYTAQCVKQKEVPILKEVFVKKGWSYEYVCKILNGRLLEQKDERLDTSIKNLVNAKEYMLERLGLKGKINSTLAVFSLKQLGWRDQQQVDVGADTKKSIKITLVKPD